MARDGIDGARLRAAVAAVWPSLVRGPAHLRTAAQDPKLDAPGRDPVVYLPRSFDPAEVRARLEAEHPGATEGLELRPLPAEPTALDRHGLLYQPGRYVVPGGRFNELYGWDAAFIQRGLLLGDEVELAVSMLEQLAFQIERYGMVLNANRTYYLTRSQPPLFTRMVWDAHRLDPCRARLARMLPLAVRYHALWVSPPRLEPETGLARYRDAGHGPAPEVLASERDADGLDHYARLARHLAALSAAGHPVDHLLDGDHPSALAYLGDRSMRESGFDASDRFGPLNLDVVRYLPVCLNTFLVQMERDIADLCRAVGEDPGPWDRAAATRAARIEADLFDEALGLYADFDLERGGSSGYPFLTTFLPLWAGIAAPERARRVRDQLPRFERPGGLVTSQRISGCQWDAPFGWAPLQLFAVSGLHRYGFESDARRIAERFLSTVQREYDRTGCFREKYDVTSMSGDLDGRIAFGYPTNEVGFGWTNAAVLELLEYLDTGAPPLPLSSNHRSDSGP